MSSSLTRIFRCARRFEIIKKQTSDLLLIQNTPALQQLSNPYLLRHNNYCAIKLFSSNSTDQLNNKKNEVKPSLIQRFKQMYKDYWYVLVPVHLVTSLSWVGGFYYLSSSGVDIPALLEYLNFSDTIVNKMRNSSMGHIAIAYALYKIVTPVRYAVTLGGTTVSIQYLNKWGYLKSVPDIKEDYKRKRDNLKETMSGFRSTLKDNKTQKGK